MGNSKTPVSGSAASWKCWDAENAKALGRGAASTWGIEEVKALGTWVPGPRATCGMAARGRWCFGSMRAAQQGHMGVGAFSFAQFLFTLRYRVAGRVYYVRASVR